MIAMLKSQQQIMSTTVARVYLRSRSMCDVCPLGKRSKNARRLRAGLEFSINSIKLIEQASNNASKQYN